MNIYDIAKENVSLCIHAKLYQVKGKAGNDLFIFIERAKKVEELIELYRHLYFHDKMMSEDEFYQTLYKIKALEEELK